MPATSASAVSSSQSATVVVGGPAFGYTGPTDVLVYWDTVYSTYMFAFASQAPRISGVATEWDFVEAPSQMLEEWIWDPSVLATFARHHETGEPIPAELVERMKAADDFGNPYWCGDGLTPLLSYHCGA